MKWAIREAVDVYFKAKSAFKLGAKTFRSWEPVLIFDTLKTATLEATAETSYAQGGRGNVRLLGFDGNKALTFKFEDALLSNEGVAIIAGADLIPARNKNIGNSADAKSVIAHTTEKKTVSEDSEILISEKPYVGHGSDIYVMLLDTAGEISGEPIQIKLNSTKRSASDYIWLNQFAATDTFIAIDRAGKPMKKTDFGEDEGDYNLSKNKCALADDRVGMYIKVANTSDPAYAAYGIDESQDDYTCTIGSESTGDFGYLIDEAAAVYKTDEKGSFYVANIPSIKEGDAVLIDYYVEHRHDATNIRILPEQFAPYMYVEGSSLIKRASDGKDLPVEFVIPKLKIKTALSLTLSGSGDPSSCNFEGDAFPDFTRFDNTTKVLAEIQTLGADDNYDGLGGEDAGDPTNYNRVYYNEDEGEYIWKDPEIKAHDNIDWGDYNQTGDKTPIESKNEEAD